MHPTARTALSVIAALSFITACSSSDDAGGPSTAAEEPVATATTAPTTTPPTTTAPATTVPTTTAPTTTVPTTTAAIDPQTAFEAFEPPESLGDGFAFTSAVDSSEGLYAPVLDDPACAPTRLNSDSDFAELAGWTVFEFGQPPTGRSISLAAADPALVASVVEAYRTDLVTMASCLERMLQGELAQPDLTFEPVGVNELTGIGVEAVWMEFSLSVPSFALENLRLAAMAMSEGPLVTYVILNEAGPAEVNFIAADLAARLIAAVDE